MQTLTLLLEISADGTERQDNGNCGLRQNRKEVAKLAEAFGMTVLVYSGHVVKEEELSERIRQEPLQELLRKSDVISLHCPLTRETRGLINRETIAQMKDGVLLLNDSRGALIAEEDLKEALISGKVQVRQQTCFLWSRRWEIRCWMRPTC